MEKNCWLALGKHIIADIFLKENTANDIQLILNILNDAAIKSGATILKTLINQINETDYTLVLILSESHISFHKKENNVMLDIFTCGDHTMPIKGVNYVIEQLLPEKVIILNHDRGKGDKPI